MNKKSKIYKTFKIGYKKIRQCILNDFVYFIIIPK